MDLKLHTETLGSYVTHLCREDGGIVADLSGRVDRDVNGRRLAACWNFCAGVSRETLERSGFDLAAALRAVHDRSRPGPGD